ncbi:MAG: hypothetical protein ABEJ86_02520 [Halococcoides sp.]
MLLGIPGVGGMAGGPELLVILFILLGMFVAGPLVFVAIGYVLGKRSATE